MVRVGESLRQAAARETAEETGLDVEMGEMVTTVERIIRDDGGRVEYHFVIVDFLGEVCGGELGAASDARSVRWVALAELERLPTTHGIAQATARALELARRPAEPNGG